MRREKGREVLDELEIVAAGDCQERFALVVRERERLIEKKGEASLV